MWVGGMGTKMKSPMVSEQEAFKGGEQELRLHFFFNSSQAHGVQRGRVLEDPRPEREGRRDASPAGVGLAAMAFGFSWGGGSWGHPQAGGVWVGGRAGSSGHS